MSAPTRIPGGIHIPVRLSSTRMSAVAGPIAIGAALAIVSSIPLPRGPVTTGQALLCVGASVLAGLAAGRMSRSSWSILLAPLGYVVAYEAARLVLGVAGATFGPIRLDNAYGIVALVAGRGFHGLLALLPMAAGASLGVVLGRPHRRRAWIPGGLLSMATLALTVAVVLPASVPPVTDEAGQPVPGSIAELSTVTLGGLEQTISVRAADPEQPVLLYLSGGPGQSDIAFARALLEPLTGDFVVVTWDQRGNGTSYPALEPVATFTLDRAVNDTVELAEQLTERFGEQKVYLLGESWGSTLGVLAVDRRPDLFHAYIGSGQMVSQRVTDQRIWRDLLATTEASGDWELYDQVLSLGEPPYRDAPWANSIILGLYPLLEEPYTPPQAYVTRGVASGVGPFGLMGAEYDLIDNVNLLRGLLDTFSLLYPQLQAIDFRTDVPRLEVPVYLLDGTHELRGRRDLAQEWFASLSAPHKELITYENAGHAVAFEQAEAFHRLLVEEIVPATYEVR